ncbi:MAG TPA: hypothetical protein VMY41_12990 [Thermohalobaculum sp.]|nr:hypothetical protein [Thermohalobaculum sp.]
MKIATHIAAVAAIALFATGASAQSAKFAANYAMDTVTLADFELNNTVGFEVDRSDTFATELLATIRAPKGKEFLIGVSGVANIVTFTEVKARNKAGASTAVAEGIMNLEVRYAPTGTANICTNELGLLAAPGPLTFAARKQTLSVTVDLDVIDTTTDLVAEDLAIDGSVTVALGLDTTAAHHFNFVAIDLPASGEYDVVACFSGDGSVSVTEAELGDNTARSFVAIAHRMVTVQEVRAVKDSIIDLIN